MTSLGKKGLTEKQYKCLEWITNFINKNGWCPSTAQIAKGMQTTDSAAANLVRRIIEKGYLTRDGKMTLMIVE